MNLCRVCGTETTSRKAIYCSRLCCNRDHAPAIAAKLRKPVESRFWSKVNRSGECWEWKASTGDDGYGHFTYKGKLTTAHKVAYELTFGTVSPGIEVHHTCKNRACVRPEHLEALPVKEHQAAHSSPPKTHCPHGHEYTLENTAVGKRGQRSCRTCHRASYHKRKTRAI